MRSVGVPKILDYYEERGPSLESIESVLDLQTLRRDIEERHRLQRLLRPRDACGGVAAYVTERNGLLHEAAEHPEQP